MGNRYVEHTGSGGTRCNTSAPSARFKMSVAHHDQGYTHHKPPWGQHGSGRPQVGEFPRPKSYVHVHDVVSTAGEEEAQTTSGGQDEISERIFCDINPQNRAGIHQLLLF